jgi:hypothetical protein
MLRRGRHDNLQQILHAPHTVPYMYHTVPYMHHTVPYMYRTAPLAYEVSVRSTDAAGTVQLYAAQGTFVELLPGDGAGFAP